MTGLEIFLLLVLALVACYFLVTASLKRDQAISLSTARDSGTNSGTGQQQEQPIRLKNSSAILPQLNRYDYGSWFDSLKHVLSCEGSLDAIFEELEHEDPRNLAACSRIRASVPIELQEPILRVRLAKEMIDNLANTYSEVSYDIRSDLETEIRTMKLKKYDSESVEKHLKEVQRKLHDLMSAGGNVEDRKLASILATTLPSMPMGETDHWQAVRSGLSYGLIPFKHAMASIRNCAHDLLEKGISGSEDSKALSTRSGPYYRKPFQKRDLNSPWRKSSNVLPKCFACESDQHLMKDCEMLKKFKSSLNNSTNKAERSYYLPPSQSSVFVIDSGSSHHNLVSGEWFNSLEAVNGSSVTVANGSKCEIKGVGQASINSGENPIILTDARFTPRLDTNLLSVSQLTNDGYSVYFEKEKASILTDSSIVSGEKILEVPRVNNLYLHNEPINTALSTCLSEDWHSRWGHPGIQKTTLLQKLYPQLELKHPSQCEICILAKQKQLPYHSTGKNAESSLELIHADLCVTKSKGFDGSKYFLILVDEYSRYIHVAPIKDKSSLTVLTEIKKFIALMERQLEKSVKILRSDGGLEFQGEVEKYLVEKGIRHERSVPYCHPQNGSAERAIQTITTRARCLLLESCMPESYWPLAVKTAAFVYNLSPHSAINQSSPVKRLFPHRKDFLDRGKELHIFGSAAARWIPHEQRTGQGKFLPTSEMMIFVGYDSLENDAFLLLNQSRVTLIRERNVRIMDGIFPFCIKQSKCSCDPAKVSPHLQSQESSREQQLIFFDSALSGGGINKEGPSQNPRDIVDPEIEESPTQIQPERPPIVFVVVQEAPSEINNDEEPQIVEIHEDNTMPELEYQPAPQSVIALPPPDEPVNDILENIPPKVEPAHVVPEANPEVKHEVISKEEDQKEAIPSESRYNLRPFVKPPLRFANEYNYATRSDIPTTYTEAMTSPAADQWREAQCEEYAAMRQLDVFDEVKFDSSMKLITCRWVYNIKKTPAGTIDSFRARLVARGFTQEHGVDFWETFSPTVMMATVRIFLTVCKSQKLLIHQLDVSKAFLHGDIDGLIYVKPPKPFDTPGVVWKLKKSLYGLKQSPRLWMSKLNDILLQIHFKPTKSDKCLFVRKIQNSITYLIVYVDDILIGADSIETMSEIKHQLMARLTLKDLGKIGKFLNINFIDDPDLPFITASQQSFIEELVIKYQLSDASPIDHLPPIQTMDFSQGTIDESLPIRNLVGALLFISNMTRPDISAAVSYLSRYLDRPNRQLWKYCKMILNFLNTTKHRPLLLGNLDNSNLLVYADSNYAPHGDRKSQSGAVFKFAGSTVHWLSKKQKTVSTSTTEAEYISLSLATNETLWMQNLLNELHVKVNFPTVILEDNQPAIAIVNNQRNPNLAKHIDVKYRAIQDYHQRGLIKVQYIPTKLQLADYLTKVSSNVTSLDRLLGSTAHVDNGQGECYVKGPRLSCAD